jgi:16S rRNA (uracil1498-N3)-methyltransferase
MGRHEVWVKVERHLPLEREVKRRIHLAVAIPANERMAWLIEKATELGAISVQPLLTSRTVVKLSEERSVRKQEHWQAIVQAASAQCGRNRLLHVYAPRTLQDWLTALPHHFLGMLSLAPDAIGLNAFKACMGEMDLTLLSGPEGGFSDEEEQMAKNHRMVGLTLGPAWLRAETAPLAALAALGIDA